MRATAMNTMSAGRKRLRSTAGLTIGELLVTVLLLALLGGAMTVGIRFGVREYQNAVRLSEARMLIRLSD